MSGGAWVWAVLMVALVIAYASGIRSDGMNVGQIAKIALIWAIIIGGAYLLVSWITGIS